MAAARCRIARTLSARTEAPKISRNAFAEPPGSSAWTAQMLDSAMKARRNSHMLTGFIATHRKMRERTISVLLPLILLTIRVRLF
jgi:hypothetical protein